MKTKKMEKKLVLNKTTITTMTLGNMADAKGGFTAVDCVRTAASYCYETCEIEMCFFTDFVRCTRQGTCPV